MRRSQLRISLLFVFRYLASGAPKLRNGLLYRIHISVSVKNILHQFRAAGNVPNGGPTRRHPGGDRLGIQAYGGI